MKQNLSKFNNSIVITIFLIVILASYIKIYFGINFTDESFYIALPYRFFLGNIPIKDEYSICQFAGILLYPIYYLYLLINHTTDAIMLFARHLYLLFFSTLTLFSYLTFKKDLGWRLALLTASICIAFLFFNIPSLSYDTLAIFFLTMGCLCNFKIYHDKNIPFYFFAAGFCFSMATFVYPPLFICLLASFIILSIKDWRKTITYFTPGSIPSILLLFILIYFADISSLWNVYHYLIDTGYNHQHINHLSSIFLTWKIYTPGKKILFLLLALSLIAKLLCDNLKVSKSINLYALIFLKRMYQFCALILPIIMIAFYWLYLIKNNLHGNNLDLTTYCYVLLINLCLLAPYYLLLTPNNLYITRLFVSIWLPSLIAGIVTGLASANGIVNCIVGLFPAFIASSIIIGHYLKYLYVSLFLGRFNYQLAQLVPYIFTILLISILMIYKYSYNYQEISIYQLTHKITNGPFKYLYTSVKNKEISDQFYQDMRHTITTNQPQNILIYPAFPAGYLFSNRVPTTNSVWLYDVGNKCSNETIAYLKETHLKPDVLCITKKNNLSHNLLINYLLHSGYTLIQSREMYNLYFKNKSILK